MAADPMTADVAAELLNYDLSDDDPFNDTPLNQTRDDKATLSPRGTKRKTLENDNDNSLGLDEEVKITKKRKPAVKLDEARYGQSPRAYCSHADHYLDYSQHRGFRSCARSFVRLLESLGSCV